jgi:hypothetical protein
MTGGGKGIYIILGIVKGKEGCAELSGQDLLRQSSRFKNALIGE